MKASGDLIQRGVIKQIQHNMSMRMDKYEFDLTVKHYGQKPDRGYMYDPMYERNKDNNKQELLEKLEFKTLSAVEVIRKLLDYLY